MPIASLGGLSGSALRDQLEEGLRRAGLADQGTARAGSSAQVAPAIPGTSAAPGAFDPANLRESLARQMAQDVQAGRLKPEQSEQISQALAQFAAGIKGGAKPSGVSALSSVLRLLTSPSDGISRAAATSSQTDTAQYLTQFLSRGLYRTTA